MPAITPDYQIAAGNNNAGGLTLITSITDANSVPLLMPRGLPHRVRGERRFRVDGTTGRVGQSSTHWTSKGLLVAQYRLIIDTYEGANNGQVTIRIALSQVTFANYNATLWMPDEDDLEYVFATGSTFTPNFVGPCYRDVDWNFTNLVAL